MSNGSQSTMNGGTGYGSGIKVHPNVLLSVIASLLVAMSGLIVYIWLDFKEVNQRRYEQQQTVNKDFREDIRSIKSRQQEFEFRFKDHDQRIKKNSHNIDELKQSNYE